MIQLFQLSNLHNRPDINPLCGKVELYLRVAKIDYEVKKVDFSSLMKYSVPYIKDNDARIYNSDLILEYLAHKYQYDFDLFLNDEQKIMSFSISKMIEKYFYLSLIYSWWIDVDGAKQLKTFFRSQYKFPMSDGYLLYLKRYYKNKFHYMLGYKKTYSEDIYDMGIECIALLSSYLGDKKYFMGHNISMIDIAVFPFLYSVNDPLIETPFKLLLKKYPNLNLYLDRILENYF